MQTDQQNVKKVDSQSGSFTAIKHAYTNTVHNRIKLRIPFVAIYVVHTCLEAGILLQSEFRRGDAKGNCQAYLNY